MASGHSSDGEAAAQWKSRKLSGYAPGGLSYSQGGDGLYAFNFRDLIFLSALDSLLESQLSHRTAAAGAFQSYLNDAVLCDFDEFNIAAVGLQAGAYILRGLETFGFVIAADIV